MSPAFPFRSHWLCSTFTRNLVYSDVTEGRFCWRLDVRQSHPKRWPEYACPLNIDWLLLRKVSAVYRFLLQFQIIRIFENKQKAEIAEIFNNGNLKWQVSAYPLEFQGLSKSAVHPSFITRGFSQGGRIHTYTWIMVTTWFVRVQLLLYINQVVNQDNSRYVRCGHPGVKKDSNILPICDNNSSFIIHQYYPRLHTIYANYFMFYSCVHKRTSVTKQ